MPSSSLLTLGLVLASLADPPAYRTYHNARFGYRLEYPADLKPQPEAPNGDGRRFLSADGQTELAVYASYDALDGGLPAVRQLARQDWQQKQAVISLDQLTGGGTGYVLSGQVRGRIFYERTVVRAGTFTTVAWQYPASRKAALDAVIRHTVRTLQPSSAP